MDKLFPCPYCGSSDLQDLGNTILCKSCGTQGPDSSLCGKVKWNSRFVERLLTEEEIASMFSPTVFVVKDSSGHVISVHSNESKADEAIDAMGAAGEYWTWTEEKFDPEPLFSNQTAKTTEKKTDTKVFNGFAAAHNIEDTVKIVDPSAILNARMDEMDNRIASHARIQKHNNHIFLDELKKLDDRISAIEAAQKTEPEKPETPDVVVCPHCKKPLRFWKEFGHHYHACCDSKDCALGLQIMFDAMDDEAAAAVLALILGLVKQ